MPNNIDIKLTGKDETAAAFHGATQRMQQFGAAASGTNRELTQFTRTNSGVRIAADGMRGALHGDINALDNMAQALAMVNPQLIKFAGGLTALALGAQLGKQLDKSFNISDRIAAALNGVDPAEIRSAREEVDKKIREMEGALRRVRDEGDAGSAAKIARIGASVEGPAADLLQAIERAKRESEKLLEDRMAAEDKARAAGMRLESEESRPAGLPKEMGGQDLEKIRKLRDEYKAAGMDLASVLDVIKSKQDAIDASVQATMRDAAKRIKELERELSAGNLSAEIEAFERAAVDAQKEVARLGSAIKSMSDPRLRGLAFAAAGVNPPAGPATRDGVRPRQFDPVSGTFRDKADDAQPVDMPGRNAQWMLDAARDQLDVVDSLTQRRMALRDPSERQRIREQERERKKTEAELERARDRQTAGRKLTTRETDLLAAEEAQRAEAAAKRKERENKENVELRKQTQAFESAVKDGLDRSKLAKDLAGLLTAKG